MRCESAHKAWWVVNWSVIYAADDGLVRLNGSTRSAKVIEVRLSKPSEIRELASNGTPNTRLRKPRTYLICPIQSVPAYPFAKGVSRTRHAGKSLVFI